MERTSRSCTGAWRGLTSFGRTRQSARARQRDSWWYGVATILLIFSSLALAPSSSASADKSSNFHREPTPSSSAPQFTSLASISGVVTNAQGVGVAGIDVVATGSNPTDTGSASTDLSGSYTISGLPADTYSVNFIDPANLLTAPVYSLSLMAGANTVLNTTMSNISITGRVTDASGSPVMGAQVELYPNISSSLVVTTNSSGNFYFTGIANGTYRMDFYDPSGSLAPQSVFVNVSGISPTVENATLLPGGSIFGYLTTVQGAPLTGILVSAQGSSSGGVGSAITNSLGFYSISSVPADRYTLSFSDPSGRFVSQNQVVNIATGTAAFPNTFMQEVSLTVKVSGVSGASISGIAVNAVRLEGSHPMSFEPVGTATDGVFYFTGLPAGPYSLQFTDTKHVYAPIAIKTSVRLGVPSSVEITLKTGGTLAGTVAVVSGKPANDLLSGIRIIVRDASASTTQEAITSRNGTFRIIGLTPGVYTVQAIDTTGRLQGATVSLRVSSGQLSSLVIELPRISLVGEVTRVNGVPIKGIEVFAHSKGSPDFYLTSTDSKGSFILTSMKDGIYQVSFFDKSQTLFPTEKDLQIQVRTGAQIRVNAEMTPGGSISGVVVGGTGRPLSRIQVDVACKNELQKRIEGVTNAGGHFTIGNLPPGPCEVNFLDTDPVNPYYGPTVEVRSESVTTLKMKFETTYRDALTLSPPTVVGSPTIGHNLYAKVQGVSGAPRPNITFQWFVNDKAVLGATLAYFPINANNLNKRIAVRVTATNSAGSFSLESQVLKA